MTGPRSSPPSAPLLHSTLPGAALALLYGTLLYRVDRYGVPSTVRPCTVPGTVLRSPYALPSTARRPDDDTTKHEEPFLKKIYDLVLIIIYYEYLPARLSQQLQGRDHIAADRLQRNAHRPLVHEPHAAQLCHLLCERGRAEQPVQPQVAEDLADASIGGERVLDLGLEVAPVGLQLRASARRQPASTPPRSQSTRFALG